MRRECIFLVIALFVGINISARSSRSPHVIRIPAIEGDATRVLQEAISQVHNYHGRPVVIELQNAEYHLYRQSSTRKLYYISNTTSEEENPDATKHIGLWMKGLRNVTIDGNGAKLVMHGEMTNFVIDSCQNICLRRMTVDFADPTVTEMTVSEVGDNYMVVRVHPTSRYEISDGLLSFKGESWSWSHGIAQTYDPIRDVTWRSWMPLNSQKKAVELQKGLVRFEYSKKPNAEPGFVFQMRDSYRDEVCGLIQYSKQVRLEHLRIAFTGNFGIVSQMSKNLIFQHLTFEPEPGSGRTCAGFADFLHLSGCGGDILVEESRFVGAHDDPINVHGTHLRVMEFLSETQLRVCYMHSQTFGFQSFLPGDTVDVIDAHTLLPVATAQVRSAVMEDPRSILVTLKKPLPEKILQGRELVIENATYTPSVVIRGNYFARVPTRGILVTTRRPVIIENNLFFRMQNSAIKISDDARSWFESGMVRDVLIKGNEFVECGTPVISVAPENDRNEGCVHHNIRIKDNRFVLSGTYAVEARSVDGLQIKDNSYHFTDGQKVAKPVKFTDCENVENDN